jgi:tetratricopeptide (TPR) repeat protein
MDWFRKKSWTKKDEEHFFTKLKLARKWGRPQYLKIQAIELIITGKSDLLKVAESLLIKILDEYPNEHSQKSEALNSLGDIYKSQNDLPKAIEYYKMSLDFEKEYPNVQTQSYLNYSELIIKTNKSEEFDNVLNILITRKNELLFPIDKYKTASIISIIYYFKNELELAKQYAKIAEKNANAQTSGLSYHKNLGVVKERINWLDKLVNRE